MTIGNRICGSLRLLPLHLPRLPPLRSRSRTTRERLCALARALAGLSTGTFATRATVTRALNTFSKSSTPVELSRRRAIARETEKPAVYRSALRDACVKVAPFSAIP